MQDRWRRGRDIPTLSRLGNKTSIGFIGCLKVNSLILPTLLGDIPNWEFLLLTCDIDGSNILESKIRTAETQILPMLHLAPPPHHPHACFSRVICNAVRHSHPGLGVANLSRIPQVIDSMPCGVLGAAIDRLFADSVLVGNHMTAADCLHIWDCFSAKSKMISRAIH